MFRCVLRVSAFFSSQDGGVIFLLFFFEKAAIKYSRTLV